MATRDQTLLEDFERMKRLRALNPRWLEFQAFDGQPPQKYEVTLHCKGVRRLRGKVKTIDQHQVRIYLGPGYPINHPDLIWITPILHPNILAPGVCFLPHWGANTRLDEVCIGLWDMARYQLFNLESPLDPSAGSWVEQHLDEFPLDSRDLRARLTAQAREMAPPGAVAADLSDEEIHDLIEVFK